MPISDYILSCDIGGSHITSAIVDRSTWTIIEKTITRSHVNSLQNAKSIFQEWTSNMKNCLAKMESQVTQIGIAAPGPFDYEKGIPLMKGQAKYDSIYKVPVTDPIIEGIGDENLHIRYINDAAAFLQGEVFGGRLEHKDCVLGVTLGTGLGSAVWRNGEKAFDADLWNTVYKDSIYEEYLVTRWFTKRFEELTGKSEKGLREILENNIGAEVDQLLKEYSQNLASFLHFFSQKHQCKHLIIGGNIVKAWDLIFKDKSLLEGLDISIGKYQEHAAIIGAASLFSNEEQ